MTPPGPRISLAPTNEATAASGLERLFYNAQMRNRGSQRPANVAYYLRNREREIERVRTRQASTLAFLRDLRNAPCADCGVSFLPYQMDFDHRDPSLKSFQLTAGRAMLKSHAALINEARKCDIVCANCHRLRTREWHQKRVPAIAGNSRHLERKRNVWRVQAELLDSLRDVPCADCERRFPPCAMDFDHRDAEAKKYTVTRMIGRAGTARILAEVAKCDIVCTNCHRARTYDRRMAGRDAGVAQLVERQPSKLDVAGSNPVSRSNSSR